MILNRSVRLYILLNFILLCKGYQTDNQGIGYPESEEEDPAKKNAQHKVPLAFPSKCKPGELYYPGDQNNDWVCDCKPGYIYYPSMSQCFPAFQRGPCQQSQYLVLPKFNVIPECVRNPCDRDNFVVFNKQCWELNKSGPCPLPELSNVIGVNETTLEIICTRGFADILTRLGEGESPDYYYNKKECFIGGKRWTNETCPQQIDDKAIQSIFLSS